MWFKKKEKKINITETIENNLQMVEYKENLFRRFLNKIKNIFRKNKGSI